LSRTVTRRTLLLGGLGVAGAAMVAAAVAGRSPDTADLATRCRFGAWSDTSSRLVPDHRALEALVGVRLPVFSWFQRGGWDRLAADAIGRIDPTDPYDCLVAWEAWDLQFDDVLSGARDDFFRTYFDAARTYPGRVVIRLFHEPNGNWYPWGLAHGSAAVRTPEQWRYAWQRIVGLGRERADKVEFMFCANSQDVGGVPAEEYWPGAEWVDVIGVDGYNWGWSVDGSPWTTAEQVIEPMYQRLTALHPTAEFMVGEIGCVEHDNKARWHEGLFTSQKFPRLTQLAFFHEAKEHNWRLDSDDATLEVVQTHLARAPQSIA
jgi:mannan endo-1,4-beta-mannosidase